MGGGVINYSRSIRATGLQYLALSKFQSDEDAHEDREGEGLVGSRSVCPGSMLWL
jgi:hypothetical protein